MANLSLKHIYKIYDNGTKAVDDFNLEIGDNEFIVFVGPSGCGKSTTLRMIAGLEDITAGDFYIDGVLSNGLEPKNRDMAMVFQNYALYPHMSVYDNMAFGLKIRHVPKDEISQRVYEAAKILDIENQLDKKPKAMSGGQRQRVALGRAIVRKPKVFLLDEPLSNLDAKLRSSMRSEITRLHNVLGTTFIYVTHDQIEAMTMGTRIVVMKLGVMQQVDTPMNLYDYPANEFVAGFIGTPQMNFFDGTLSYEGKNVVIKSVFKDFNCKIEDLKKLDILNIIRKEEVVVGIRPEHLKLSSSDDKNAFETEIVVVEALGNESNLIVETTTGRNKLTIKTLRNDNFAIGQKIYLALDISKTHLFKKETTNTILPRCPEKSSVHAKVSGNVLHLFGKEITLPDFISSKLDGHRNIIVSIPNDAFAPGKTYSLKFINKEKINKKWLFTFNENDDYLYRFDDNYIDGTDFEFDLLLSKLSFFDEEANLLVSSIDEDNVIDGVLTPSVKELPILNSNLLEAELYEKLLENDFIDDNGKKVKVRLKKKDVFNYFILGQVIEPSLSAVIKIYSLLGKKFAQHSIQFSVKADKFKFQDNGQFEGKITSIIDYGKEKYYKVDLSDKVVIVSSDEEHEVGEEVKLFVHVDDIGVNDLNFKVKLI